jgi:hypothetical protein
MRKHEVGFEIKSKQADELLGWSVAGAGDFNGDSFEDVIVGAPGAGRKRGKTPGMAFVYHGKKGKVLFELEGEEDGDRLGWSVHGAGDTNADGADDVIIGTFTSVGYAKLVAGRDEEVVETFRGEREGESFGATVDGAFDFDSDGFDDILIGAPGDAGDIDAPERPTPVVRIFSGKTGTLITMVKGQSPADHVGCSLSGAGDVNNDGFGDFIVGDDQFGIRPGSASVYIGSAASKRRQKR